MAFKTFAPGVLTSSDINTFLMRQSVITCTAATRPASPNEGMTIFETDTDSFKVYDGANWVDFSNLSSGAWTSYTPTLGNGWTLGNGTLTGAYMLVGKICHVSFDFTFGSTTTAGTTDAQNAQFSLPFNMNPSNFTTLMYGSCLDLSLSQLNIVTFALGGGVNTVHAWSSVSANAGQATTLGAVRNNRPFTWATGDTLSLLGSYRIG